ncbi:MAG: hypothetical protein LBS26_04900 [Campylobacteraceae bacterium]|jgi:hypothetical protein|nr:hypothetical protein [Campylobacteraceae bacterium]
MYFTKFSLILIFLLTLTSCSDNKTSSSSATTGSGGYQGGETVDGYTLPPMPPKTQNDATLLGIDTNNNGIRDDVEIYIYNRFQGYTNSKVEREIAMQYAKTATQLIQSPETAYEDKKHEIEDRALDCKWYYYDTYLKNVTYSEGLKYRMEHDVLDDRLDDAIFNTKDRLKAYFKYNASMSGHVFSDRIAVKEACDFDVDALIEGTL